MQSFKFMGQVLVLPLGPHVPGVPHSEGEIFLSQWSGLWVLIERPDSPDSKTADIFVLSCIQATKPTKNCLKRALRTKSLFSASFLRISQAVFNPEQKFQQIWILLNQALMTKNISPSLWGAPGPWGPRGNTRTCPMNLKLCMVVSMVYWNGKTYRAQFN